MKNKDGTKSPPISGVAAWWYSDEGMAYRAVASKQKLEYWASEEGLKNREKLSKSLKAKFQGEEGEALRKKRSEAKKEWYKTPAGIAHKEMLREHVKVRNKEWYQSEEGQKFLEERKAWYKTPAGRAHQAKMAESCRGKNNHRYQAFIIEAHLPCGKVLEYTFDSNTPTEDAHQQLGLQYKIIKRLKDGGEWNVVRTVKGSTKHGWVRGTVVTMTKI